MPMAPRLATSLVFFAAAGLTPALITGRQAIPAFPAAPPSIQGGPIAQPKGTAFVVGQVLDGTSGRPVSGALVTLNITTTMSVPGTQAASGRSTPPGRAGQTPASGQQSQQMSMTNAARVLADGDGRFLFHDIPAGRVSLSATAAGYTSGGYGMKRSTDSPRTIILTDGARVQDATIRIWKLAAASGIVVDETGDPLVGVTVTFLRFQNMNGVRRTSGGPNVPTDDRGAFHFTTSSGDFLIVVPATSTSVSAASIDAFQRGMSDPTGSDDLMRNLSSSGAPMPNMNGMRVGTWQFQPPGGMGRNTPPVGVDGAIQTYQTTFYPAALVPSQAQVISLSPGEERGNLDITMRLSATSRVMGQLSGPDGAGANLGVKLVVADSRDSTFNSNYPAANTLSEPNGAFTFLGVPPGQYELQVTRVPRPEIMNGQPPPPGTVAAPTLWARVPVSVGSSDVAGVNVVLRQGARVSGRIEFDGATQRPAPERLSQVSVLLQDLDNQGQPSVASRVGADGQFTTQGVLPGHYLLTIANSLGAGWTLRSATANGKDYSVSPQVLDGDVSNVIVTFTDHPNRLDGSVQLPQPAADNPTVVVYFPANYQAWLANGTSGRTSRVVRVDETNGHFTVGGIPAGDYDFAAIPSDVQNDWQDPKTVEALARVATRLQIGDDEHKTIDLKPVTIR
jgi:hypothetical protein